MVLFTQQYFPIGQFVSDPADLEGDGMGNQIEYAPGYSRAQHSSGRHGRCSLDGIALRFSLSERLSDAQQITVWINDGKLPHPPRLVFEGILPRDASPGQLCQSKIPANALHV